MIIVDRRIPPLGSGETFKITRRSGGPFRVVQSLQPGYLRLEIDDGVEDVEFVITEKAERTGNVIEDCERRLLQLEEDIHSYSVAAFERHCGYEILTPDSVINFDDDNNEGGPR